MERDRFLARVRAARRGANLPDVVAPDTSPPITFADPVTRFVATATEVGGEVVRVDGPDAACREVLRMLRSVTPRDRFAYIAWDGLDGVVPGLYDDIANAGGDRLEADVGTVNRSVDHRRVGEASVGITGADAAIAATGSVVLTHGPGRPRSASLLVEHHVVLLPVDRIVPSLREALEIADWSTTSNWVAVTGPSRTGDIESILTIGVHGPRRLSIVLIG